ncbi:MAG: PDZ domain-containing protein [Acidimicrobiia bacterium]
MDTLEPIVPGTTEAEPVVAPPPDGPLPRWVKVLAWLAAVVAVAIGVSSIVYVDYYSLGPGPSDPTEPRVRADNVPLYVDEDDGRILFATVRERHLTALAAVVGWLDPHVDVIETKKLFGTQSRKESREQSVRAMGASKDTALYVALRQLGYPVQVSSQGLIVTFIGKTPAADVLKINDIITSFDDKPVSSIDDVRSVTAAHQPGDVVAIGIKRNAEVINTSVTLAKRDTDGSAYLGISYDLPADAKFSYPFPISIDSGDIIGPSAGLAFTLGTIDALTPGSLTAGQRIAATGTIDVNGQVGPIGGIQQKVTAVRQAGATVFLVPASEAEEAEKAVGTTGLEIVPVNNIGEALTALDKIGGNALKLGTPGASYTGS